jgi:nucleotide-binding universal stress UspA family protein
VIENVLVPHDLTEMGDRALETLAATGLRWKRLHVVHVLPRVDLAYPGVIWSKDEDAARQAHALGALQARFAGTAWADAICHVAVGDAGARTVDVAQEIGAGLVVLATHARAGLNRAVRGSVADHVARFARCPVLVVPPLAEAPHAEPSSPRPAAAETREEQVDRIGGEVTDLVESRDDYLVSLVVGIPHGESADWWEEALTRRLAAPKIDYVDFTLVETAGTAAVILDARFEEAWAP